MKSTWIAAGMLLATLGSAQQWLAPRDEALRRLELGYRLSSRQQEAENREEGRWRWESPERYLRVRSVQHRKVGEERWSEPMESRELRLDRLLLIQTPNGKDGRTLVRIEYAKAPGGPQAMINPEFRPGPCLPLAAGFPRLAWRETSTGVWEATDRSVRWTVRLGGDGVPVSAKAAGSAVTAEFDYLGRVNAGRVPLPGRCEHRLVGGEIESGFELTLTEATDRPAPIRLSDLPWDADGVEVVDARVEPAALYFEGEIPRLKAARNGRLTLDDLLEESRARSAKVAVQRERAADAQRREAERKATERLRSIAAAAGTAGLGMFVLGFVAWRRLRSKP